MPPGWGPRWPRASSPCKPIRATRPSACRPTWCSPRRITSSSSRTCLPIWRTPAGSVRRKPEQRGQRLHVHRHFRQRHSTGRHQRSQSQRSPGPDSGNVISNNLIENVADEYHGGVGIFAGYVANTLISHNEVADLPYTGISLGWVGPTIPPPTWRTTRSSATLFTTSCDCCGTAATFCTLGPQPGWIIENNYVQTSPSMASTKTRAALHRYLEQRGGPCRRFDLHLEQQYPRPQRPQQLHRYDAVRQQTAQTPR